MTDKKVRNILLALAAVAVLGAVALWLRPSAPPPISAPVLVASAKGLFQMAGVAHTAPPVEQQAASKNILLLYSYGHGGKGIGIFDDGLLQTLSAGSFSTNQLFFEYLDLERNIADSQYRSNLRNLLDRKYKGRTIDLIVTVQQPALNYLLNEGRGLAEEAPAITVQAPMPTESEVGKRRVFSMLASFDIKGTLERALELFPDTRRVVFVAGASEADRNLSRQAASIAQPWQGRLEFEYTTEISLDAMLKRVASLPPRTIVIFTQYNRDTSGKVTVAYEVEAAIIKAANAPVLGLYDFNLVNGGIGGSVVSVKNLGQRAGILALDLLNGRQQLTQPVTSVDVNTIPMFDWEQIKRWGGNVSGLPSNTVFVNRVPTFWEQYRLYVIGVGVFVVAQSLLIAALLISRRKRRLIQRSLQESEENLAITLHSIGDAVVATDGEGLITRMNPAAERLTGWPLAEARGQPLAKVFHIVSAETRLPSVNPVRLVMESGKVVGLANHTLLLAKDGQEYQIADSAAPIRNAAGKIVGAVLVISDVTEKYRAQETLRVSEDRYRALVEWSPDPILVHSGGKVIYANPAAIKLYGAPTTQDLIGKAIFDLIHPDVHQIVIDRIKSMSAHGVGAPLVNLQFLLFDGTTIDAEVSSTPVVYDGEPAILVSLRDLTERKRVEALVHEGERRLASEQAAALEAQRQAALAARGLMEDAITARHQAEMTSATLAEQLDELRRWQQVTLDREDRVLAMKKEVNELLAAQGQPLRYASAPDEVQTASKGIEAGRKL